MYEILLLSLFFLVAFFHSSVGLGGGTSYTALLILSGYNYLLVPSISLTLNICVSAIATFHFFYNKHLNFKKALPFIICSFPFAYLGGTINLPKNYFIGLVIICLIIIIVKLQIKSVKPIIQTSRVVFNLSLLIGALIGFISGLIGIGGGIFLIPILIIFNLAKTKEAMACGAIFILTNSIFGLLARYFNNNFFIDITNYTFLFFILLTFLGGFLGSFLGSKKVSSRTLRVILSSLLCLICILLMCKL